MMHDRIPGPTLLGFGDFFEDESSSRSWRTPYLGVLPPKGGVTTNLTTKSNLTKGTVNPANLTKGTQTKGPGAAGIGPSNTLKGPTPPPGGQIHKGSGGKPTNTVKINVPRTTTVSKAAKTAVVAKQTGTKAVRSVLTAGRAAGKAGKPIRVVLPKKKTAVGTLADGYPYAIEIGSLPDGRIYMTKLGSPADGNPYAIEIGCSIDIGAAAKPLTPAQKAAASKLQAATSKSKAAGQKAAAAGKKAKASVLRLAKAVKVQRDVSRKLRGGKGGATRVRGIDLIGDPLFGPEAAAILGEHYALVGAEPDPENPGYLTDGTPDPAAGDITVDPGAGDLGDLNDIFGVGEEEKEAVEMPPAPPMDTFIPDMVKAGGIEYDGAKGEPNGYVGSLGLMTRATDHRATIDTRGIDGVEHYGFVWGKFHDNGPEKGIPHGDNLPSQTWNWIKGRYILGQFSPSALYTGSSKGAVVISLKDALEWSAKASSPHGVPYGPLVGNPNMDFKGMRVDAQGKMFWLPQEAPEWLLWPLKQAAALTYQEEKKARDDAAKADAAAREVDRLEEERQLRALELAEATAASEARVTETKQASEADQLLIDEAKSAQEQTKAKADAAAQTQEQSKADAELQRQMMQMEMEQARAQMQMDQQYQMQQEQQGYPPGPMYPPGFYPNLPMPMEPGFDPGAEGGYPEGYPAGEEGFDPYADPFGAGGGYGISEEELAAAISEEELAAAMAEGYGYGEESYGAEGWA